MSNDFPFGNFLDFDKLNNNNNLEQQPEQNKQEYTEQTSSQNFVSESFNEAKPTENQGLMSSAFNNDELSFMSQEILEALKNSINPQKYKAFFEKTLTVSNITENTVQFCVTTSFIKTMIEKHYSADIKQILLNLLGTNYNIQIDVINKGQKLPTETLGTQNPKRTEVSNEVQKNNLFNSNDDFDLSAFFKSHNIDRTKIATSPSQPEELNPQASVNGTSFKLDDTHSTQAEIKNQINSEVIKQTSSNRVISHIIDRKKTFNNFIVGPSNNMAHAFSLAVSKDPGSVYPQIYVHGNSGLGKTHLLHAICNYIADNKPQLRICFTTANDFMSEMILAIQGTTRDDNKIAEFRRKYTDLVDVLIIDDIHELKNRARTQAEFFYIFNELQGKGKQLIFTSDKAPKEIVGIEDRIRTRLSSALLIDIQQPDLETRIAILKKKAIERDILLEDDVINLIASCVKNNVRELEGNLVKLGAYSDLMNVDIDLEIAKEQLNLQEGLDEKLVTIESIARAVSSYYKLALGDVKGKTRKKEVALARHIGMYMSHKILKKTLEEIGEYFDNRDHSTVIHGIKKIQNLVKENPKISQQVFEIETRI